MAVVLKTASSKKMLCDIFREYYGCPMAGFSIPAAEHRYYGDCCFTVLTVLPGVNFAVLLPLGERKEKCMHSETC